MRKGTPTNHIFRQLGCADKEAQILNLRARLMAELEKHIREKGLPQKKAAGQPGVIQPWSRDLMRGKINLLSVDSLITMFTNAGLKIDVKASRSAA